MSKELRKDVIRLATKLALQATEKNGLDYSSAISGSLEKACKIKGISHKSFISMFTK